MLGKEIACEVGVPSWVYVSDIVRSFKNGGNDEHGDGSTTLEGP